MPVARLDGRGRSSDLRFGPVRTGPESSNAENSALTHLKAYVEAFNSGIPGEMKAFFEAHVASQALKEVPVEQRLTRFRRAKIQLKSLELQRVVSDEPFQASVSDQGRER